MSLFTADLDQNYFFIYSENYFSGMKNVTRESLVNRARILLNDMDPSYKDASLGELASRVDSMAENYLTSSFRANVRLLLLDQAIEEKNFESALLLCKANSGCYRTFGLMTLIIGYLQNKMFREANLLLDEEKENTQPLPALLAVYNTYAQRAYCRIGD